MIYQFENYIPVIHPTAFIHPLAAVTGNVIIGKDVYIGPGAAIRGDFGRVLIEDGCNVQENCTIHMFPGCTAWLKEHAHIGHGAIIHGAVIGRNCLVGMNAVIMDHVVLEEECIVGALSFVKEKEQFEKRSLIAGNPARLIREVSDEMIRWKSEGTAIYRNLPKRMQEGWKEVEPLRELPNNMKGSEKVDKIPEDIYKSWTEIKN